MSADPTVEDIIDPNLDQVEILSEEEQTILDEEAPQDPQIEAVEPETPKEDETIDETVTINDVPQQENPVTKTGKITRFRGEPVRYVELTGSKIDVPAASIYTPGAVSLIVDGVIDSFRVSCNDAGFRIVCKIRDHEGGVRTIMNETVGELALDGAGMTTGEIQEDVTSSAMDKTGTFDPSNPYIMRGKNQFSGNNLVYEQVLGTPDDRFLVVNFSPIDKLEFSRIEFYIENTTNEGTRRIRKYKLNYMEYVSAETKIPDKYILPSQLEEEGIEIDITADDEELANTTLGELTEESLTGKETLVQETIRKPVEKDISIEAVDDLDDTPINLSS